MTNTVHRSNTRGRADFGWLKSHHTFSFGSYFNPARMNFGALRVLNDDFVEPSMGFGTHPHANMEIVSIPLSGSLRHKDSEGNQAVIQHGEVQIMSAGTGVRHSEYNNSESEDVNFLQIWVMPDKLNIDPRYDQKVFNSEDRSNKFQLVVSPDTENLQGVKINQQAYFSLIDLDSSKAAEYSKYQAANGIYIFVISGEVKVGDETLASRDALALENLESVRLEASKDSEVLVIEVPDYRNS